MAEVSGTTLRVATRGSRLARAQVAIVREWLGAAGFAVEPVYVETRGDRGDREALGAFVREVQVAVLEGRADLALHCLKDLPTDFDSGLELRSFLPREDPRDALISAGLALEDLPSGFRIGTGSLRRTTQLSRYRRDGQYLPLVGNVDSRLQRLKEGDFDAIVLAMAGIQRLGGLPGGLFSHPFAPEAVVPAAGQGVLVLEGLAEGPDLPDDSEVRRLATLERRVLAHLGGGCSRPIGVYGERDPEDGRIHLRVVVANHAGTNGVMVEGYGNWDDPEDAFESTCEALLEAGAAAILREGP